MHKSKQAKFTNEFEEEAVRLVSEQGYTIAGFARNLGINDSQLSRWKNEIEEPSTILMDLTT